MSVKLAPERNVSSIDVRSASYASRTRSASCAFRTPSSSFFAFSCALDPLDLEVEVGELADQRLVGGLDDVDVVDQVRDAALGGGEVVGDPHQLVARLRDRAREVRLRAVELGDQLLLVGDLPLERALLRLRVGQLVGLDRCRGVRGGRGEQPHEQGDREDREEEVGSAAWTRPRKLLGCRLAGQRAGVLISCERCRVWRYGGVRSARTSSRPPDLAPPQRHSRDDRFPASGQCTSAGNLLSRA